MSYFQVSPRRANLLKRTLVGIFNFRFIAAPKILFKNWKVKHCYDIETELSDGTLVITTNAEIASTFAKPPSIETEYFAYGTPMKQLLQRHNERLSNKFKNNAEVSATKITSAEDLMAMQARQQAQKKQTRIAVGLISLQELEKMAGNAELARVIHEEIQTILKETPL